MKNKLIVLLIATLALSSAKADRVIEEVIVTAQKHTESEIGRAHV